MRQHRTNTLNPIGRQTGQNTPKSNFFCQENLTKPLIPLENNDKYSLSSKMGNLDKSALAGALMMGGAALATPALAEQSKLDMLTDPALTEQMIRTSGFMIPDAGEGAVIGIPIGGGNYQMVERFSVTPDSVEDIPLASGSSQLLQPGSNAKPAKFISTMIQKSVLISAKITRKGFMNRSRFVRIEWH